MLRRMDKAISFLDTMFKVCIPIMITVMHVACKSYGTSLRYLFSEVLQIMHNKRNTRIVQWEHATDCQRHWLQIDIDCRRHWLSRHMIVRYIDRKRHWLPDILSIRDIGCRETLIVERHWLGYQIHRLQRDWLSEMLIGGAIDWLTFSQVIFVFELSYQTILLCSFHFDCLVSLHRQDG